MQSWHWQKVTINSCTSSQMHHRCINLRWNYKIKTVNLMSWCCISWKISKEINQNDQIFITVCVFLVMTRWRHATRSDQSPIHQTGPAPVPSCSHSNHQGWILWPGVNILNMLYWISWEPSMLCYDYATYSYIFTHIHLTSSEWSPLPSSHLTTRPIDCQMETDGMMSPASSGKHQTNNKTKLPLWQYEVSADHPKVWQFSCLML